MDTVTTHGPLFDGRADAALRAFRHDAAADVGRAGVDEVRAELHHVLRHPTGYYESHIAVHGDPDGSVVTDGGVIYGPWLEGVGSRNRTTRFKGYATFRRVTQQLQARAVEAARPAVDALLRRLG